MVVKYAVDAAIIGVLAHKTWTPVDYLTTGIQLKTSPTLRNAPPDVAWVLVTWTVPFLWIGLTLTMRRALDAGKSAWLSLLFFIPVVNYVLMAWLSLTPSRAATEVPEPPRPKESNLPGAMLSIAAGAGAGIATGLAILALTTVGFGGYGLPLFLGSPFIVGAITAYVLNRRYPATARETNEVVLLTICAIAGAAIAFVLEGVVCIAMALPLAIVVSLLGSRFGRFVARRDRTSSAYAIVVALTIPISTPLVDPEKGEALPLHAVQTVIEIDADTGTVWRHVIAFPPLAPPTEPIFRTGVAYPVRADIAGAGVGAIRYCVFSTGAFVEPIRAWQPGRLLAFDISAMPDPMRELTPYGTARPPHLDGYLRTTRGEFRLIPIGAHRTRIVGTTWYDLRMAPDFYWSGYADWLIGKIHRRVLTHIKQLSEKDAA